eukprot:scaffold58991_cov27-Tisochrysis_lutea.AAC.3
MQQSPPKHALGVAPSQPLHIPPLRPLREQSRAYKGQGDACEWRGGVTSYAAISAHKCGAAVGPHTLSSIDVPASSKVLNESS